MAIQIKTGSFTKSTAGAPVSQVIAGIGFTPKAIIMWTEGGTVSGTFHGSRLSAFGISSGAAASQSVAASEKDAVAVTVSERRHAAKALTIIQYDATLLAECDLTSFDANGFTLNWTTNNAVAYIIHYIAIGGSELSAKVVLWTSPTATGNKAVTGVGFVPDFVLHATGGNAGAPPVNNTIALIALGAMSTAAQWAQNMYAANTLTPSQEHREQHTNAAMMMGGATAGTPLSKSAFVSMDADGFTTNFSVVDASARQVISLCLKGGHYAVGAFNKVTGGAPASQVVTGVGFKPMGILLASFQNTAAATNQAHARQGTGAFDNNGGTQASARADQDNVNPSVSKAVDKTSKGFVKVDNNTSTVDAEADLTSMDADGFTLSWSTNDAVATEMLYVAIGSNVTAASLAGAMPAPSGSLVRKTLKALAGVVAAGLWVGAAATHFISAGFSYFQAVAGIMPVPSGDVAKQTNKPLAGAMPASSGILARLTSLNGLAGDLPAATGTIAKKVLLNGLSGVVAAGQWAGSVIASVFQIGSVTFLGGGTLTVTGLDVQPITGQRLYIVIYDSLGNKLGSGPIYQIQRLSFTKRLDRGGDFEFAIAASDDRAVLINQGREIRVYREGEGEIYRGVIEQAMWEVTD
jgi:hypothetical protein